MYILTGLRRLETGPLRCHHPIVKEDHIVCMSSEALASCNDFGFGCESSMMERKRRQRSVARLASSARSATGARRALFSR